MVFPFYLDRSPLPTARPAALHGWRPKWSRNQRRASGLACLGRPGRARLLGAQMMYVGRSPSLSLCLTLVRSPRLRSSVRFPCSLFTYARVWVRGAREAEG